MSDNAKDLVSPHVRGNGATALPAGMPAPDFALKSTPDQTVRLSEFRGHPVVLVFYPANETPTCNMQLSEMNINLESAVMLDFQPSTNIIDDWDAEF